MVTIIKNKDKTVTNWNIILKQARGHKFDKIDTIIERKTDIDPNTVEGEYIENILEGIKRRLKRF